jgi:hypothetical protein
MMANDDLLYEERITSNWTLALFMALAAVFFLLFIWRVNARSLDILAGVLLLLSAVFLFYTLNYRTLIIRLTAESLKLKFGVFTWTVPLENVAECRLDDNIPALIKYGGAGIHFYSLRERYRASFNFLEHPRVVIAFKEKVGPVRDLSFSTRRPDDVLRLVKEAVAAIKLPSVGA